MLIIYLVTVFKFCDCSESLIQLEDSSTKNPVERSSDFQENIIIKAALLILTKFTLFNNDFVKLESNYININTANSAKTFLDKFVAGSHNVDVNMTFKNLVNKYGFEFEHHAVVTEDGYVLSVFRIPSNGSVVFLMHDVLGSSDDFIIAGAKSGLAYLLARNGYDVWLGNARGNKHSRRHISLSQKDATFWDFSWHEIGIYDLPAMINYVLDSSNKTTLKYIGYSQGTTAFFVMVSERPEYNTKVSLMIAMSPVAYMSNAKSPIFRLLSPFAWKLPVLSKSLHVYEFMPDQELMKILKKIICGRGTIIDIVCSNVLFILFGFNYFQLNATNLPVVFGHLPAGASVKQFAHYSQGLLSGDFRSFDYGSNENLVKYGSIEPPVYKLNNVETPISMFFSDNDWMSDPQDVAFLSYRLKTVVDIYKVPFKGFSHLDFILSKDVIHLVYTRIINVLNIL